MSSNSEPTLTQGIIFSDSTIREHQTGKVSYIGSFQQYNLPQFPFVVPPFHVSFLLSNIASDMKGIDATVRIENPQNSVVLASSALKLNFSQPPNRDIVFELSIPVFNLKFSEAGKYSVVVLVNNEKIGERSLFVHDVRAKQLETQQ